MNEKVKKLTNEEFFDFIAKAEKPVLPAQVTIVYIRAVTIARVGRGERMYKANEQK